MQLQLPIRLLVIRRRMSIGVSSIPVYRSSLQPPSPSCARSRQPRQRKRQQWPTQSKHTRMETRRRQQRQQRKELKQALLQMPHRKVARQVRKSPALRNLLLQLQQLPLLRIKLTLIDQPSHHQLLLLLPPLHMFMLHQLPPLLRLPLIPLLPLLAPPPSPTVTLLISQPSPQQRGSHTMQRHRTHRHSSHITHRHRRLRRRHLQLLPRLLLVLLLIIPIHPSTLPTAARLSQPSSNVHTQLRIQAQLIQQHSSNSNNNRDIQR